MIDFTNCKRVLSKAYSGANGKKIAVEYEGEQYMLKFPPSGKERKTELSYINSCYSEHLGSSIFNMLGINAQKTMLGTFTFVHVRILPQPEKPYMIFVRLKIR